LRPDFFHIDFEIITKLQHTTKADELAIVPSFTIYGRNVKNTKQINPQRTFTKEAIMPRRRPADPPPRRQRITNDIGVVDAETLIRSKRSDISAQTKDLIHLLCDQSCTIHEIVAHLIKRGHIDQTLDYDKQKSVFYRLAKHHKLIKNENSLWFVVGSQAEYSLDPINHRPKRRSTDKHWLREFIFDALSGNNLTLGQLSSKLRRSGIRDTFRWSHERCNERIHGIIVRNLNLFEKENDRQPYQRARWCLKPKAKLPTSFLELQTQALWNIMMSANQIPGWRLIEIQQTVSQPTSGFKTGPDTQALTVKRTLCTKYLKDERFIKLGHGLYRAKPPRILKKPADKADWFKLVINVAKDLGKKDRIIPEFEVVRKGIVQYGHLYGYDTQAMGDFLNNQVAITYTQLFGSENVTNMTPSPTYIDIEDEDEDEQELEEEKPEIFWPED